MTQAQFEVTFNCRVVQWGEFDGDNYVFSAVHNGALVMADTIELLALALTTVVPYRLAA